MDALSAVRTAVTSLGYPCAPDLYTGSALRYVTYNYAAVSGGNFGDNRPSCNVASVQVHLFLPYKESPTARRNAMQGVLFDAGFTWPSVRDASDLENTDTSQGQDKIRHLVFECEYEETLMD